MRMDQSHMHESIEALEAYKLSSTLLLASYSSGRISTVQLSLFIATQAPPHLTTKVQPLLEHHIPA